SAHLRPLAIGRLTILKIGRRLPATNDWLSLLVERLQQLLELLLIRGDGLCGPCELEEYVSARTFYNRAQQPVAGFHRLLGRHRSAHPRIFTGDVQRRNGHSLNRAFTRFRVNWLAELALPS